MFLQLVMEGTVIWPSLCLEAGLVQGEARALSSPPQAPLPCTDSGLTEVALLLEGEGRVESGEGAGGLQSAASPSFLPDLPVTSIAQPGPLH